MMAATTTKLILPPCWGMIVACLLCLGTARTAVLLEKSSSLSSALAPADDKGSSSASEDFIDLDAAPSHVLHEVGESSKESEVADSHDSMPLPRPKTIIEVDSDEAEDVIHSGSGDDLESLGIEKNSDKNLLSADSVEAKANTSSSTSTQAYPSSTQANYNPSTSTTSTPVTYTSTPAVHVRSTSHHTSGQSGSNDVNNNATHTATVRELDSSLDEVDEGSSGSGSGSGEYQCNEHNCKYGGVCDQEDSEDSQCNCEFDCKKEDRRVKKRGGHNRSHNSSSSVCGSDHVLYTSVCDMKRASCFQQKPIVQRPTHFCVRPKAEPLKNVCKEHAESSAIWSPWSPWIQAGDKDIRYRSCHVTVASGKNATNITCVGYHMMTRQCPVTETKTCRTANGSETTTTLYQCKGHDPMDVDIKDSSFLGGTDDDKCRYSLYKADSSNYKFTDWTYDRLRREGKTGQWCGGPLMSGDNYRLKQRKRWDNNLIAMYTPLHACKVKLDKFCRELMAPCKYMVRNGKRWADGKIHNNCLKNLSLGGSVPTGIPNQDGGLTFLCQRFSANTIFGEMFKSQKAHFATLYDTMKRLPTFSLSRLTVIDDNGWPRTQPLMERALIDKQPPSSWFYIVQYREKGLAAVSELGEIMNDQCAIGKYQAQPSDYDFTSYRIGLLLQPQLVGHRVDTKIASFAMTNTVPMHSDFYVEWKRMSQIVYKYAVEMCRVPKAHKQGTSSKGRATATPATTTTTTTTSTTTATTTTTTTTGTASSKDGTTYSAVPTTTADAPGDEEKAKNGQLYLVAGAVPSMSPKKTIGNGVNVPHLIWMGGCCIQGNETKGFAVYGQNTAESLIGATSLPQLEILLSQEYTKHTTRSHPFKIKIFPAFQGRCSRASNDDSLNLVL